MHGVFLNASHLNGIENTHDADIVVGERNVRHTQSVDDARRYHNGNEILAE